VVKRRFASIALALWLVPSPAPAQSVAPQSAHWSVAPQFGKNAEARKNLSGAACAPTQPPYGSCLAVNDEKKYAQFFTIVDNKIVPNALIRLLGDNADSDPDIEGAAYHDSYFYVAGSHGVARMSAKDKKAPFTVFRFKVDPQTGKPAFEVTDRQVASQIEKSTALRAAIGKAEFIGAYAEKPLDANGVNIEGIALEGDRIYFGFRGPSLEGRAFILSTAIDGMFGINPLDPMVHALALGPTTGIRDLASVDGGFLVLSGPVNEQEITPAVHLWIPASGALKKLGELGATPAGAKAETLLVLEQQPERYRVLVMHDGPANGQPMEYWLPRE
jgi:Protein of unknown function (DUF3616)